VAYHGDDGGVVPQGLRDADRDVGAGAVVHDLQGELPTPHSPARVDLLDRQLGRALHRDPPRLRERTREPEHDSSASSPPARARDEPQGRGTERQPSQKSSWC
jgi:hypothetical protein